MPRSLPEPPGPQASRARLLIGLGNPTARYARTRHNVGFDTIDAVADELGVTFRSSGIGGKALLAQAQCGPNPVWLLKPVTFMNLSGHAIAPLARRKGLDLGAILVIHDDLDLTAGKMRLRRGGGAGGHRGVASIIEALGDPGFVRLKVGIGRPPDGVDPADYVLQRPAPCERESLDQAIARAAQACMAWVREGFDVTANRYNSDPGPVGSELEDQTDDLPNR